MQKNELLIYILDAYIIILFIQYLLFSGIPRIFPETLNIFEFLLTLKKKEERRVIFNHKFHAATTQLLCRPL